MSIAAESTAPDALTPRHWLLLVLACLALFLPGFATLPPTDRDESRYIVTSQRMADTGDLIDLRFQDQPRYLQPAGIYWLQSAATAAFDSPAHDSVWAYRLPSLQGALLSVLMTAWLGAKFFGRTTGLAAAALLAACFSLNFEARIAKIDAALLCAIVAAQLALMRAYVEPNVKRWVSALFWSALGVGLMLKGPVILIVSGGTIAALLLWERKTAWLSNLRALWGVPLMLAIALPWFIAIGVMTDGAFYERALMRNFLGKVGAGEQGHSGPIGYHLGLFMLAFWPGSLLVLRAAGYIWRQRTTPLVRFLICWIVPTWIVFEFVATKLPHYVLPTYPALALLAAASLFEPNRPPLKGAGAIAFAIASVLWIFASAFVAAGGALVTREMLERIDPLAIGLGVATFAAACASLFLLLRRRDASAVAAMVLSAFLAWSTLFGVALPNAAPFWMSPRIADAAKAAMPCEGGVLVTTPYSEPSLVFLYGRERTRITPSAEEAATAFADVAACGLALIGAEEKEAFSARAAVLGVPVREVDRIEGRNYSNGDDLVLTLYAAAPR